MTENAGIQQPVMGNEPAPAMGAQPTATPSTLTADELQKELETIRKALKDANKEAETRRKRLDEFEAKEKQEADAKLSEMEKMQKAVNDAKAEKDAALSKANDRLIRSEILSKSTKFIDPDVVIALVDKSKVTVKEDGTVEGVDAVLEELAKAKPHLLKGSNAHGNPTNPGSGASQNETWQEKHNRLIVGDSTNVFGQGGGIVWPPSEGS